MQSIIEVYRTGDNVARQDGYLINGEYRPGFYGEYRNMQSAYKITNEEQGALDLFRQECKTQSAALSAKWSKQSDARIVAENWLKDALTSAPVYFAWYTRGLAYWYNRANMPLHARACQLAIEEI